MNLIFSGANSIALKRADRAQAQPEGTVDAKVRATGIPWIFRLVMESCSAAEQPDSFQPSVSAAQFARFLLMSRLQ